MFCTSLFVFLLLAIVLSVLLYNTASEFPFDLLKLFLSLLNYKGSFDGEQNGEYIILALVITVDP